MTADLEVRTVMLDTEVLRRDPTRKGRAFTALASLVGSGAIKLYISEISMREFISAQEDKAEAEIQQAAATLRQLGRAVPVAAAVPLDEIREQLERERRAVTAAIGHAFNDWLGENSVEVLPINSNHGMSVINGYFEGNPPFAQKKRREDIPDAFIFQALYDLEQSSAEVAFVSADRNMAEAATRSFPRVRVFSTLEEFLALPGLAEILQKHTLKSNVDNIVRAIPRLFRKWDAFPRDFGNALIGLKVPILYPVSGVGRIARVLSLGDVLVEPELTYVGSGIFSISFSTRIVAELVLSVPTSNVDFRRIAAHGATRDAGDEITEVTLHRMLVVAGSVC